MGFWMVNDGATTPLELSFENKGEPDESDDLTKEKAFDHLLESKEAYMSNHVFNEDLGFFVDFSKKKSWPLKLPYHCMPLASASC